MEVFVGGEGVDCVGGKVDAGFRKLLALNAKNSGKFGVGELRVRREREGKKGWKIMREGDRNGLIRCGRENRSR